MSQQARRARFYHRQRQRRIAARIIAENLHRPGFLGAVTSLVIGGKRFGHGALFIGPVPTPARGADEFAAAERAAEAWRAENPSVVGAWNSERYRK